MLFIVRFNDKPDSLNLRQRYLPDHLEWLDQNQTAVLVAGSLRATAETDPTGACWVVEARSRDEIDRLLQGDPFWQQGLRVSYEIMQWSKAFPERKVPV